MTGLSVQQIYLGMKEVLGDNGPSQATVYRWCSKAGPFSETQCIWLFLRIPKLQIQYCKSNTTFPPKKYLANSNKYIRRNINYTVFQKTSPFLYFYDNFVRCWPI